MSTTLARTKYYPWIVWLLTAAFFSYKYIIQVSPSVMSTELMRTYHLTGAGLGHLAACFFYAYFLMQLPVGLLLDRFSPRFITALAVCFCALSTIVFAQTDILFIAESSRFVMGLTAAFAAVACFKLTTLWFPPHRFALVSGLSMTAAMMGAVFGEAPLSFLVTQQGWRHALLSIAIGCLILAGLMFLIIRDKPTHQEKPNLPPLWQTLKIILKHPQTWLLSLYSGCAFAPISVFGGLWGVSFLEKAYALSPLKAAQCTSLIFIGFAIGCPITGWLSDYHTRRKPLMLGGTLLALLSITAILYLTLSIFMLSLFLFTFGLGASCFFLCFSMIREIHPLLFSATVLGFMNTFDSICEAVTEPFIGKLLDLSWNGTFQHGIRSFSLQDYHWALLTLPLYLGAALIILVKIKETNCIQNDFNGILESKIPTDKLYCANELLN